MNDYISREKAIRALEFRCKILTARGAKTAASILTRYGITPLKNRDAVPAANVAEVKRLGAQIYLAVHNAGACDPSNDYDRGYDDGISAALDEITRLTGVNELCLDEEG